MAGRSDEIGDAAGRALKDLGPALKPVADVPTGLMKKQKRNQAGVEEIDAFDGNGSRPSSGSQQGTSSDLHPHSSSDPYPHSSRAGEQLAHDLALREGLSAGSRTMAGHGTDVPIRDVGRLTATYGGEAGDWAKNTSTVQHVFPDGRAGQVHWYENVATGQRVDAKLKMTVTATPRGH